MTAFDRKPDELYAGIAADNRAVIDAITDLGKVLGNTLDARCVLLHPAFW